MMINFVTIAAGEVFKGNWRLYWQLGAKRSDPLDQILNLSDTGF